MPWDIENQRYGGSGHGPLSYEAQGLLLRDHVKRGFRYAGYAAKGLGAFGAKRMYDYANQYTGKRAKVNMGLRKRARPSSKAMVRYKRQKTSHKARPKKGAARVSYRLDGYGKSKRVYAKGKGKRRTKRSLKKRVSALEKNGPTMDTHWEIEDELFRSDCNGNNQLRFSALPMITSGFINRVATTYGAGVASGNNISLKFDNIGCKVVMKGARAGTTTLKYQIFKCVGDCTESLLDDMREHCINLGLTITNGVDPGDATVLGTSVMVPEFISLNNAEVHTPFWTANRASNNWKPQGNIKTVTIGPGDNIEVSCNIGKFTYQTNRIEEADAGTVFFKNHDYVLLYSQLGGLGHGSLSTDEKMLGYSRSRMDGQRQFSARCKVFDGSGEKTIKLTSKNNGLGANNIVHVDDHLSGFPVAEDVAPP